MLPIDPDGTYRAMALGSSVDDRSAGDSGLGDVGVGDVGVGDVDGEGPSGGHRGDGHRDDGHRDDGHRDAGLDGDDAAYDAEHEDGDEPPEPPPELRDVIIGLDASGTTFDAGLVTPRGELISESSVPIEHDVGPQTHFASVVQVVTEQLELAEQNYCRVRAIGIASPGPITPNCEQVSPLSIPAWRDFPLRQHLIELTRLPTYGDLDAKALALSEGWLGVARGRKSFASITVSASVGGGLVIDGDLLDGANGNAGHVGHVIVEPGGRRCRCGARGCLDAEASGLAIEAITGRSTSEPSYDIMRRSGTLVGRAAAIVCNSLDLDFVVVGGDVAEDFAATFMNAAQQEADRLGSAGLGTTPHVASARLGRRGVLIGAGAIGIRGIRRHRSRR